MSKGSIMLDVQHSTEYHYVEPVLQGRNEAWLIPRETPIQKVLDASVSIKPEAESLSERVDYFGNPVISFEINDLHQDLVVTARSRVEITPRELPPADSTLAWESVRALCEPVL